MPKPKKEEADSNNGMSGYYMTTFLMFGLLSLYCFQFYSTWGGSQCMIDDSLPVIDGVEQTVEEVVAEAEADPAAADGARRNLYETINQWSVRTWRELQEAAPDAPTGITETQKKKAIAALSNETGMKLIEGSSTALNSLTMAINYAV